MEKPARVQIGQRWGLYKEWTVTRVCSGKCEKHGKFDPTSEHAHLDDTDWNQTETMLSGVCWRFLGYAPGYGPQEAKPEGPNESLEDITRQIRELQKQIAINQAIAAAPRIPPQPSARQVIEARKKEKPEPWVESCDPLHWIKDA